MSFPAWQCKCGNDRFKAHQRSYHDVIVNSYGTFIEDEGIYESENPYGPFICAKCGIQHDELGQFNAETGIGDKNGIGVSGQ